MGTKEKFNAVKSSELAALLTIGITGSWLVGVEGRKIPAIATCCSAYGGGNLSSANREREGG